MNSVKKKRQLFADSLISLYLKLYTFHLSPYKNKAGDYFQ